MNTAEKLRSDAKQYDEKGKPFEGKASVFLVRADHYDEINPTTGEPYKTLVQHAVVDGVMMSSQETRTRLDEAYLCGCQACLNCKILQAMRENCQCFYGENINEAMTKYRSYFESLGMKCFEVFDDHKMNDGINSVPAQHPHDPYDEFCMRMRDFATTFDYTPSWGRANMWGEIVAPFLAEMNKSTDERIRAALVEARRVISKGTEDDCLNWLASFGDKAEPEKVNFREFL